MSNKFTKGALTNPSKLGSGQKTKQQTKKNFYRRVAGRSGCIPATCIPSAGNGPESGSASRYAH
jgi:hypothetical protein